MIEVLDRPAEAGHFTQFLSSNDLDADWLTDADATISECAAAEPARWVWTWSA